MRDLQIANRLRARGLTVVETAGWTTRGSESFNPCGSVDHHTAGPRSGNAPSLGVVTNGRSDLPGPLCNVLVGRDNTCYVIAAGRANHAGTGSWRGLSGNSSVYGVERENVGTPAEPWRDDQSLTAALIHAALIEGRSDASSVCLHKEWAPKRKIDAHSIKGDDLRHVVALVLAQWAGGAPAPAPTPAPDTGTDWAAVRRYAAGVIGSTLTGVPNLDGSSPKSLYIVVLQQALNLVTGTNLKVDGVYGDGTIKAVWAFQQFMNALKPNTIKDFPGAAHEGTRFMLVTILNNIRDGKA